MTDLKGENTDGYIKPDPTFYPSPRSAMQAAKEKLAYVVAQHNFTDVTGVGQTSGDAYVFHGSNTERFHVEGTLRK